MNSISQVAGNEVRRSRGHIARLWRRKNGRTSYGHLWECDLARFVAADGTDADKSTTRIVNAGNGQAFRGLLR